MTEKFIYSNIDLTYVFLKQFQTKIKAIKDHKSLQTLCEFMLDSVVTKIVKGKVMVPNINAKILELGLKVLHKAWKALIDYKWENHSDFLKNLTESVGLVRENFPNNDIFRAEVIKLQTLAARYYVRDATSFEGTEQQLSLVAEMILENSYMAHKENVRIVSAKSFATLIPLMSVKDVRKNIFFQSALMYETYLTLMLSCIYLLTDELP